MRIIDGHCDLLWRLWTKKYVEKGTLDRPFYKNADWLMVTKEKLKEGGVGLQACAIYISEEVARTRAFLTALEMVDLFYTEVVSDEVMVIRGRKDLEEWEKSNRLGLILTMEGVEGTEGDFLKLHTLYHLGVRWVGLTHNPANLVADGVGEARGAGLSQLGREFVQELNRLQVAIDVSHLSERGFWDVLEISSQPVFASHSNAKSILPHRRNLSDVQISALVSAGGLIGLTYAPHFTAATEKVTIDDLLRHVEHYCSLGAEKHIGLGSDFDGISKTIEGLEHSGKTAALVEKLLRHYDEKLVEGFLYRNYLEYLKKIWIDDHRYFRCEKS
ncbi:dipeptidase [Thermicanus aegyptius]|uniref:dipeptidase n=1 Tax=Thermicanus aegyptius TaxID=94009 RepID=UPI00041E14E1|nr:dipeptidase [Thermicanus aegyptius]